MQIATFSSKSLIVLALYSFPQVLVTCMRACVRPICHAKRVIQRDLFCVCVRARQRRSRSSRCFPSPESTQTTQTHFSHCRPGMKEGPQRKRNPARFTTDTSKPEVIWRAQLQSRINIRILSVPKGMVFCWCIDSSLYFFHNIVSVPNCLHLEV